MKNKFLFLWLSGILSTVVALPYIFTLQHSVIEKAPVSVTQLALISIIQSVILLAVTIFLGLKLSKKINLPTLAIFESKKSFKEEFKNVIITAIPIGIIVGIVIKFLDLFLLNIPDLTMMSEKMPFWKAIMAAPYGGVVEELLMRLFLVTLFAWIISKIVKETDVINNSYIMWTSIILASIIFGLGHLPATATVTQITPLVVTRAIILNGIGGLVFGWLYWKKGLEYAILAHFTTDVVLIAILPLLLR